MRNAQKWLTYAKTKDVSIVSLLTSLVARIIQYKHRKNKQTPKCLLIMVENAYVHLQIPYCSPAGLSANGSVHLSPSAKYVPPALFLYADIRVHHSPFGSLNEITDSPLDYPLFHVKTDQKRYFFLKFPIDVNYRKIRVTFS